VRKRNSDGLSAKGKLLGQLIVGTGFAIAALRRVANLRVNHSGEFDARDLPLPDGDVSSSGYY
jgi:hypothetical protein